MAKKTMDAALCLNAVVIDVTRFLGLDDKRIAVEPVTADLDRGTDAISDAEPFFPARVLAAR